MTNSNGGGRSTRQWMLWAFKLHGCTDCGITYPDIALPDLHCDHVDPATKNRLPMRNLNGSNGHIYDGLLGINSNQELLDELLKCEVVCSDCHKKRTRQRSVPDRQQVLFRGTGEAWRATKE